MAEDEREPLTRTGGVAAPTADPQERASVDEILAHGPQAMPSPEDRVAGIVRLNEEITSKPGTPSDMREQVEQQRARRAERNEEAKQETAADAPMPYGEAVDALELMLSAEQPPPPEEGKFEIPRLSRERGRCMCAPGTHPTNDCHGSPFVVHLRGLGPNENEEINQASLREPTKREKDRGMQGTIQDTPLMHRLLVARASLAPKFTDPRLLRAYGPTPTDVVQKWFNSGEASFLAARVTELSGWADGSVVRAKE